jgi:hypothetical protein
MSTLNELTELLKTDEYLALALMTDAQRDSLAKRGTIDSDQWSRWEDVQEEMRCLEADAMIEFGQY